MPYLLAGAFLISFSSVFVKLADVGPTAALFYRFLFGFLALTAGVLWLRAVVWVGWRSWVWAAAAGIAFSLDLFFWHRSIHFVGPGVATILANLQVFGLAVIGIVFMGERLTWRLAVAVPMSVVGLLMIIGTDWSSLGQDYRLGVVFGLLTAVCYTSVTLLLRKCRTLPKSLPPVSIMAWVCLIGATAGGVEVAAGEEVFRVPDLMSWVILIVYGAVCSGLAWALITKGLPLVDASRAGLIMVLQPTLAFVWDILIFARPTTLVHALGAAITLGAIYLGTARES
ncbi:DMT family transporter [Thermodesulfobacteriota bacterium]